MFKVTDNESFREAYKMLAVLDEIRLEKDVDKRLVEKYAVEIKRELRKWAHRKTGVDSFFDGDIERRIVKEYGIDGFVELVKLPEDIDNEAYANKFFHEYVYIEPVNSMYDCTGRAFTSWYKLFKRNSGFYAYHHIAMDV